MPPDLTQKRHAVAFFFFLFSFLPASARAQIEATFSETLLDAAIGSARLSGPCGMSADPQGNLYIADTGNNRIIKFNPETYGVRETGGFGFKDEEFDRPVDIWAANGLDVWVADYNNRRVKRYDKDLNFVAAFTSDPAYDATLQFGYPTAVTLSWQGELFLADHEFNRLLRFDIFGAPKASFGDFSSGAGQLERPAKLLTTHSGEIWTTDSLQHAIMRYDAYGNFLGPIGQDILARPAGMAEWRDRILVADRKLRRVVIFDQQGEQLADFGQAGGAPEELLAPVDVAVLREQVAGKARVQVSVVVLDAGNNWLQLFTLSIRTAE
ncbi:MAG: NHL repeat-containing protein [bacterium]